MVPSKGTNKHNLYLASEEITDGWSLLRFPSPSRSRVPKDLARCLRTRSPAVGETYQWYEDYDHYSQWILQK